MKPVTAVYLTDCWLGILQNDSFKKGLLHGQQPLFHTASLLIFVNYGTLLLNDILDFFTGTRNFVKNEVNYGEKMI